MMFSFPQKGIYFKNLFNLLDTEYLTAIYIFSTKTSDFDVPYLINLFYFQSVGKSSAVYFISVWWKIIQRET